MERLISAMKQQYQEQQQLQQIQRRRDKVQSFVAKDTVKGRYVRYCKLD
jgi:hypothetical protein